MTGNLLFLRSVFGTPKSRKIVLPRMNSSPGMDDFSIQGFKWCQLPVIVCFAMTINKAQGQSVSGKLGLDLSSSCFSHGQLYVALSRTTDPRNLYVCTQGGQRQTKNVVYREVFQEACGGNETNSAIAFVSLPTYMMPFITEIKKLSQDVLNRPMKKKDQIIRVFNCCAFKIRSDDIETVRNDAYRVENPLHAFLWLLKSSDLFIFLSYFWSFMENSGIDGALASMFGSNLEDAVQLLDQCEVVLLPLFCNQIQHWGLCVLDKRCSQIKLYDSLPRSRAFDRRLSTIKLWAETVKETHQLERWPSEWNYDIGQQLSPVQDNGHACGVHVMLNAYFYSRGLENLPYRVSDVRYYRQRLALCLESESLEPLGIRD